MSASRTASAGCCAADRAVGGVLLDSALTMDTESYTLQVLDVVEETADARSITLAVPPEEA